VKKARADLSTREFLERHAVFTPAEFRAALPPETSPSTVLNRLKQAHERGYVERIRHGVYASRVGLFSDTLPDPLLIASRLADDCVIAYHSALEAHGVAHAPFRRVTLLSARASFKVEFHGYEFVVLRPAKSLLSGETWKSSVTQLRRGNELVTVTSRERTLVDCLNSLKWAGGIEEVLRSVGSFPSLNVENVIAYLDLLGSASTVARVGWVLSADPDLWRVTQAELDSLRSRLRKGPYFLDDRSRSGKLVREWRLYVPEHLDPAGELRG
jgi:predicted transcriptional regulator of viral defense system